MAKRKRRGGGPHKKQQVARRSGTTGGRVVQGVDTPTSLHPRHEIQATDTKRKTNFETHNHWHRPRRRGPSEDASLRRLRAACSRGSTSSEENQSGGDKPERWRTDRHVLGAREGQRLDHQQQRRREYSRVRRLVGIPGAMAAHTSTRVATQGTVRQK